MAVQAQYPSNLLLLNRNVQEGGHDYSLQQQQQQQPGGGLFLDQSHMLFNNGGSSTINPRKRSREIIPAAATTTTNTGGGGGMIATPTATTTINPFFCMQSTPSQSQLIDLSLLHHHNNNNTNTTNSQQNVMVSTGLRLSLSEQQQLQQNHHHFQHHQPQNFISQPSHFLSMLSDDFDSHIKRQREELDHLLQAQGEHLRRALAEKRQRHYRALLSVAEESIARRVREKEVEVEKASRRNAGLEARAAQLSAEAQVWQAKARAQEATAASLQTQLQQAINSIAAGGCGGGLVAQDDMVEEGQAESAYVDPDRVAVWSGPSCKGCRKRVASVVVLPCRHFCLCTECDQVAQTCPLCLHVRNSSVEVFPC